MVNPFDKLSVLCVQGDTGTGETTHHPRESTNMRTQTVASYFRVRMSHLITSYITEWIDYPQPW